MQTVTISSGVTSIGEEAFSGCTNLQTVTLPSSIASIGEKAFEDCYKLKEITIPSSVTSIADATFIRCYGLQTVTISSGVISIGKLAFEDCSSLQTVTIPSSITSIEIQAFMDCTGLQMVTLPSSVTSIGNRVFSGCRNITDVYCRADVPPLIYDETFDKTFVSYNVTLHVPTGCKAVYQGAQYWEEFANIVEEDEASIDDTDASSAVTYADGILQLKGLIPATVSVYTPEGKCMMICQMLTDDESCDLTGLSEGVYVIQVKAGDKAEVLKIRR